VRERSVTKAALLDAAQPAGLGGPVLTLRFLHRPLARTFQQKGYAVLLFHGLRRVFASQPASEPTVVVEVASRTS